MLAITTNSTIWHLIGKLQESGKSRKKALIFSHLPSYLNYLDLCSRIVRASLKEEFRAAAAKRAEHGLKFSMWSQGKQLELSMKRVE